MHTAGLPELDLGTIRLGRGDIRWVVLTHLDPDHAGGVVEQGIASVAHDPDVLALRCGPDCAVASELRPPRQSGG